MKKIIILLITICLTDIAQAQFNADNDPLLSRSLNKEAIKKVFVRTSGGSITVTGTNTGEALLEVYVRPSNGREKLSKEELQKRLDQDYELSISAADNQLSVVAKQKDKTMNWKEQLSISFKITVPKSTSSDLGTSGGSITLSDLNGDQKFATSGGSLDIENLEGKIDGRTSGGGIQAQNSSGELTLSTSGGSLNLAGLKGIVKAKTSGGSILASNISGELTAHTSGGSVLLKDIYGSLDASTSGGSMDVDVKQLGKYVTVATSGGSINLQIPAGKGLDLKLRAQSIKVSTLTNFSGSKEEDEINGTMNGGGIPVSARTSAGRLMLAFK